MGKPVPTLWGCTSRCRAGARGTRLEEPGGPWGTGRGVDPLRDAWKVKEDHSAGAGSDSPKATLLIWVRSFSSC